MLDRAYRRLGHAYPRRALFLTLLLNEVVILFAIGALRLYVDMSTGEFVRLVLLAWAFELTHDVLAVPLLARSTAPVVAWLRDGRREADAPAVWEAAATLPWNFLRRDTSPRQPLGVVVWLLILAWAAYFAWTLELPAYAAALLFGGNAVYFAYAYAVRLFVMERVMRPVVADIAASLPEGATPPVRGLSLRARLLTALPAINVITAVTAYGIARGGDADLRELAIVVLIAAAVAATVSLALTLLLSDSITEPITELRTAAQRVGAGDVGTRVAVVTTDETGDLGRAFNDMAAGLAERERIREAFGTYVDRDVAEHILREGTSLAGEEVEVTMMFIDVRDFTGFAERASAPEVVATINRLFEQIVPVIHDHGGHVDKFVGDGLLAVFGAPRRQSNHADEALAAALEIARGVRGGFAGPIEIGVGLNSGTVVAGNVGGAGRLDFSVIGDAVNVAARVESATRQTGDEILLTERTRQLLRDVPVTLQERRGITLKGKPHRVALFAPVLEGVSDSATIGDAADALAKGADAAAVARPRLDH